MISGLVQWGMIVGITLGPIKLYGDEALGERCAVILIQTAVKLV
jgi:hypothetical protein